MPPIVQIVALRKVENVTFNSELKRLMGEFGHLTCSLMMTPWQFMMLAWTADSVSDSLILSIIVLNFC